MQDMSDLRKSIAERLGIAAKSERPGAKAKMANEEAQMRQLIGQVGAKPDKVIYRLGAFEMHYYGRAGKGDGEGRARRTLANLHAFMRRTGLDTQGAYYQPIDDRDPTQGGMIVLLASTFDKPIRASRPGAKAKMAADPALASFLKKWKRNEADNYHSENVVMLAKFVGASGDVAEANRIMQQHDEMGHLTPELNSKRYALYTALKAKLLAKYPGVTFSRPGVKAKMGKDLRELNTYLSSLIRQRDMLVSDDRRAKGKDLRVANHLNRIRQEIDAVLMDIARAEKATASRPGAKAKMGGMRETQGRGPFKIHYVASGPYSEEVWLLIDKNGKTVAREYSRLHAQEMLRKANAGEPVYVSSRPGAKGSSKAKA
jgi:hypothetical protein